MFNRVLVANRGEIAVRVIRSVQDAGFSAVAVFSEADADAPHVDLADIAVCIGPAPVGQSYLNIENILDAARQSGADAIHPGYGFLSERDDFAQACLNAELVFIGPSPQAIRLMGNKRVAKQSMIDAGVPCIPGYQDEDHSDAALLGAAAEIGFPLMVKAAAGGGGRGMRLVDSKEGLAEALGSARSEALNAFGSDELILERAVVDGRHIEIQIAADAHGNVIHLGERDCSIQRRHQKVIEEAPSPFVDEELRAAMGEAAVAAAKACAYSGVGTVEFLVDADRAFYFLEMNTRLQVEHPVTELVTGVDLVDWQLRIAAGEVLPLSQEQISLSGHAIEARLYAENPADGFLPQTGSVEHWRPAAGAGIRIDHGLRSGAEITPHYDSMVAKVIACGRNREQARLRLLRALTETRLLGVESNKSFLGQILIDQRFVDGAATTEFIDEETLARTQTASEPASRQLALAAVLLLRARDQANGERWRWSNTSGMPVHLKLSSRGKDADVIVSFDGISFEAEIDGQAHAVVLHDLGAADCVYSLDGLRQTASFAIAGNEIFVDGAGQTCGFEDITFRPASFDQGEGDGKIWATTEGLIVALPVAEGERVVKGQTVVTIEAMKMEHRLTADGDGVVKSINTELNVQVKKGQLLADVELDAAAEESA